MTTTTIVSDKRTIPYCFPQTSINCAKIAYHYCNMSKKDEPLPESRALESILRGSGSHTSHPSSSTTSTTQFFFETIYQNACVVFPSTVSSSSGGDPYTELVSNGWEALIQLLESSRKAQDEQTKRRDAHATPDDPSESPAGTVDDQLLPLLFQNQINLGPNASDRYNHSLFAAYLDGCSVVNNHADQLSPHIAALCHDLQQSFPHVYANTYLTPPNQQAVPAHADDRDVFVIQILGRKEWTVYETIPIPYPYPDEQVGKDNLTVPEQVLQGPVAIQHVLEAGNVLYMPRGFVHQARALPGEMSFHVTIALATQDWSVAGILTNATAQILHTTVEYRKAVDRNIGARNWNRMPIESKEQTKQLLDQVFDRLREQVTVKSIHQALNTKYSRHNERAWQKRKLLIQQLRDGHGTLYHDVKTVVGREASERVRFDTRLRLATEKEKASLPSSSSAQPRGLHVSENCFEALITVLGKFKTDSSLVCCVDQLASLLDDSQLLVCKEYLCNLTWLSFARQCVELGALAVVNDTENTMKE